MKEIGVLEIHHSFAQTRLNVLTKKVTRSIFSGTDFQHPFPQTKWGLLMTETGPQDFSIRFHKRDMPSRRPKRTPQIFNIRFHKGDLRS